MTHAEKAQRRAIIRQAVLDGKTPLQVATEFGVSINLVRSVSVGIRPRSLPVFASTFVILADLLNTGLSQTRIAENRGVSKQRVGQIYHDALAAGIVFPRTHTQEESGEPTKLVYYADAEIPKVK